jgi:hypothetical protein
MRGGSELPGRPGLVGSGSPDGTINYGSAARIAVKPCAFGAPLRGFAA